MNPRPVEMKVEKFRSQLEEPSVCHQFFEGSALLDLLELRLTSERAFYNLAAKFKCDNGQNVFARFLGSDLRHCRVSILKRLEKL